MISVLRISAKNIPLGAEGVPNNELLARFKSSGFEAGFSKTNSVVVDLSSSEDPEMHTKEVIGKIRALEMELISLERDHDLGLDLGIFYKPKSKGSALSIRTYVLEADLVKLLGRLGIYINVTLYV